MRRLILSGLLLLGACKRESLAPVVIEEPAGLAQTVEMGNHEHAKQLGKGDSIFGGCNELHLKILRYGRARIDKVFQKIVDIGSL